MNGLGATCWVMVTVAVLLTSSTMRTATAAEWYVAPGGSDRNSGRIESPWGLQHALAAPAEVKPGDTIWLRGGRYVCSDIVISSLEGTATQPIKVRQYPGERATFDFADRRGLLVRGGYTWYMGF